MGPIKAWSYSSLKKYEQCPHQVFLAKVKKLPGPVREEENAGDRGNRIHKFAEDFVMGVTDVMHKTLKKFEADFTLLRGMYEDGMIEIEEEWGFDANWAQCGWFDEQIWARLKCDVVIHHDKKHGGIIDHKTGEKFGNEVPHTQQGQLYAVGAFMRYPELELIDVEFWYLDKGLRTKKTYTREKALKYLKRYTDRGLKMTNAVIFDAKPNKFNCQWCDFGVNKGTGECPYAVGDL